VRFVATLSVGTNNGDNWSAGHRCGDGVDLVLNVEVLVRFDFRCVEAALELSFAGGSEASELRTQSNRRICRIRS
jgi:hypothetical protein